MKVGFCVPGAECPSTGPFCGYCSPWCECTRADQEARLIADRHYNRQKPGTKQFVPPGRCLVLKRPGAFWVTSWPFAEYTKHAWAGAWVCSAFRNESETLSSDLVRTAVRLTRAKWTEPRIPCPFCSGLEVCMVTFVDDKHVRAKRDYGRCYIKAGFTRCAGMTAGGLHVVHLGVGVPA